LKETVHLQRITIEGTFMKNWRPLPATLISLLSLALLMGHPTRLLAQLSMTTEQLDAVLAQTPLDPATLPFAGTYFLASQSLLSNKLAEAPLPCQPSSLVQQGCQIFSLSGDPSGDPGAYMVNDLQVPQQAANQFRGAGVRAALSGARAQMALASGTGCQSVGLDSQGQPLGTLVSTNQLPSGAGFLSATNPCSGPAPAFPDGLPVYSVPGYSNLFLV
jgi:hypothetical protein